MVRAPHAEAAPKKGKALAWGGFAVLLIIWAFIMGVLVGQGAILGHEQMAAVRSFLGLNQSSGPQSEPPQVQVDSGGADKLSFYRGVQGEKPAGLPKAGNKKPPQPVVEVPAPFRPKAPPKGTAAPQTAAPQTAAPQSAAPQSAAPGGKAPESAGAPPATPAAPTPSSKAADAPSTKGAPQPDGRFAVQAASYKKYSQAKALADRLAKAGYAAHVIKAELPNLGARHRVRLGPVKELSQAQSLVKGIRKSFKLEAYVIKVR